VIPGSLREGTLDILKYVPEITALWHAKHITPKQHYSEPRNPEAVIRRDLRPHSRRVYNLPPCDPSMDLMIEAKDKEQAVLALRRKWNVEGGLPEEWILRGEKMDEVREIPSEMGRKVFYEEGEEWRFKSPLKMPARVQKALDKLDKQIGKADDEGEVRALEDERKVVLEEWERKKRIKWGLEIKAEMENEIDEGGAMNGKAGSRKTSAVKKKISSVEGSVAANTTTKTKAIATEEVTVPAEGPDSIPPVTAKAKKSVRVSARRSTAMENGVSVNVEVGEIDGESKRRRTSRKA
jgi:UV-endonuclease UvdE